jgi:hypothetical protein
MEKIKGEDAPYRWDTTHLPPTAFFPCKIQDFPGSGHPDIDHGTQLP